MALGRGGQDSVVRMIFFLVVLYACLAALTDITVAAVYSVTDWQGVEGLRLFREGLAFFLFVIGFLSLPFSPRMQIISIAYLGLISIYALAGVLEGAAPGLVLASAAKLAIPVILIYAGAAGIRTLQQWWVFLGVITGLSVASALFGAWDIRHTEFWTDTVAYGDYLYIIKGIVAGYNTEYMLPWNFFGFEDARRAGGLVAAPLAQGALLACGAIMGFSLIRDRSATAASVLLILLAYGIVQSGTRGALLILVIAVPIYIILSSERFERFSRDVMVIVLFVGLLGETFLYIYDYTTNLQDGSTIGHVEALQDNLRNLDAVLVSGFGLSEAGSVAYDQGKSDVIGAEGALFSIVYQVGLIGGVIFLALYVSVLLELLRARKTLYLRSPVAAIISLIIGAATSLFISEHLLAISGMAYLWVATGGLMRLVHQSFKNGSPDAHSARL